MSQTQFGAPWDRIVKIVTAAFVGCLVVIGLLCLGAGVYALPRSLGAGIAAFVSAGLCLSLLMLAVVLAPRGYLLGPEGVTILRRRSNLTVPLASIISAEADEQGDVFRKGVRTGGMGGAFGFFGQFAKDGFGPYEAYATRRTGLVILRRAKGDPVVISPADPERFVEVLRQEMGRGSGQG
jgi:hypothetical protein